MVDLPLSNSSGSLVFGEPLSPSDGEPSPPGSVTDNPALLDVLRQAVAVGTQSTDSLLESIAEAGAVLSEAHGIAIALRQNGVIVCRARSGDIAPELGSPLSTDSGISGECLRAAAILVCSDTATDKRVDAQVCEQLGVRSIVAVPLRGRMGMVGILEAFSSRTGAFEKEQIEALRSLGEIAERAYERERRRLEPTPIAAKKSRNPLVAAGIKLRTAQSGIEEVPLQRGYWIIGAVAATVLLVSLVIGLSWRHTGTEIATNTSSTQTKPATQQGVAQSSAAPARIADANPGLGVPIRESKREASGNLVRKAAEISPEANQPTSSGTPGETSADNPAPAPPTTAKIESNEDAAPTVDLAPLSAPESLAGIGSGPAAMPTFGGTVSQGFKQAVLVKKVEPEYPTRAQKEKIAGPVTLEATVAEDGSVRGVKVVSGPSQLADAASNAVRQWKYKAAVLNGKSVETQKQITIVFKLP